MKIGILGVGSAGTRHAVNALALGHKVFAYDPYEGSFPEPLVKLDIKLWRMRNRKEVLEKSEAIIIATPSECHLDDLTACFEASKHVLVEKPIALIRQRKAVQQLIELNTKSREPLAIAVGHNLRFHPLVIEAREVIAEETFVGRPPYYASFACCQFTESQDALKHGCLQTWATHEIDLAEHLFGPLRLIDIHLDPSMVDLGLWRWHGPPCHVHIHSDMRAHQRVRQILICTAGKSISVNLEANPVTDEHYRWELEAFIERIHGDDDDTLASGEDGVAALRIAERASPGGQDPNRPAPSGSPPQQ